MPPAVATECHVGSSMFFEAARLLQGEPGMPKSLSSLFSVTLSLPCGSFSHRSQFHAAYRRPSHALHVFHTFRARVSAVGSEASATPSQRTRAASERWRRSSGRAAHLGGAPARRASPGYSPAEDVEGGPGRFLCGDSGAAEMLVECLST